jgi:cob(I)alamin adenosyltransferase
VGIATGTGDEGTTGLLFGVRVPKDDARVEANGAVDEAQAALGLARAECEPASELDALLVRIERDLWVLMAEVATPSARRDALVAGKSLVSEEMVARLDAEIAALESAGPSLAEFVVPGQGRLAASLDFARTVVRRAERAVVRAGLPRESRALVYLNRLSDLCWLLARAAEGEPLRARTGPPRRRRPPG